jgi:hypothetical protein
MVTSSMSTVMQGPVYSQRSFILTAKMVLAVPMWRRTNDCANICPYTQHYTAPRGNMNFLIMVMKIQF